MKKYQNGFSAIEALLKLVIVGMLAGVGWYVWHSQQQVDKTYSQTSNSSVAPKTKSTANSATESKTNNSYLVIKEWGVKLPMADADKVSYTYLPEYSGVIDNCDSSIVLQVKSKYLQDKTCEISVGMSRSTSIDKGFESSFTKVGKYYFGLEGNPYNCGNDPDNNLNYKIRQEFDTAKLQTQ
jgi:hypothetical protein